MITISTAQETRTKTNGIGILRRYKNDIKKKGILFEARI